MDIILPLVNKLCHYTTLHNNHWRTPHKSVDIIPFSPSKFSPFVAGMHAYLNISMNNEYIRHHHVVALFLSSCFSHDFTCKQVWTHKQDIIFRKIVFTLNMKWKMIFLSSTWCSLIYRRQNKMNRKKIQAKKNYWICINSNRKLVEWKSFVYVVLLHL